MTLEERIEKLEATLRRTRRVLACVVVVLLVGALGWAALESASPARAQEADDKPLEVRIRPPRNVVRANAFILEDENGVARARFDVQKQKGQKGGRVVLRLNGPNGRTRVALNASESVVALGMVDAKGKLRAALAVTEHGSSMNLADANGMTRAALKVTEDGPALGLTDAKGKLRAALAETEEGPKLRLLDEKGKTIWRAQ